MTNGAWLLRRVRLRALLPAAIALAVATATALPASAETRYARADAARAATRAGEWWLTALNVQQAWRAAPGKGKGVTIAVLSTGVDAGQPDLTGTVTAGPDIGQTGRKPGDAYWGAEGTAVASLIAGHGHGPGRADGITGVAPGARILSIPVTLEYDDPLNSDLAVTARLPAAIARGIRYAAGHGATVIALPLDPGMLGAASSGDLAAAGGSPAERSAVRYALARGVLLVGPAGDNGAVNDAVNYPAGYPGVIAVGATGRDRQLASFTSTGSYVALTAPGAGGSPLASAAVTPAPGLLVAAPGDGYQFLASSDMSSALTAGVAALIRGRYPWLTVAEVRQALEEGATVPSAGRSGTGQPAAADPGWGHGALDAATALSAAATIATAHPAPKPTPAPTPTPTPAPTAKASKAAGPVGASSARPAASRRPDPGAKIRTVLLDLVIVAGVLSAALIVALAIAGLRRRRRRRSRRPARTVPPAPARHARTPAAPQAGVAGSPRAISSGSSWTRPREIPRAEPRPDLPLAPWERSPADFAAGPYPSPEEPPRTGSNSGPMYIWNPPD